MDEDAGVEAGRPEWKLLKSPELRQRGLFQSPTSQDRREREGARHLEDPDSPGRGDSDGGAGGEGANHSSSGENPSVPLVRSGDL